MALFSRWLTGGSKAKEFEEIFASYVGVRHAVSVNSGTAPLHLAVRALNIKPSDEVIVLVFTFATSANTVLYCGAKPIFADIDSKRFNTSLKSVLDKI